MRSMENTKLVDSLHMPLKSYEDMPSCFQAHAFKWLGNLPERFLTPFMGDWTTQFSMQQLVYNLADVSLPNICKKCCATYWSFAHLT